MTVNDILEQVNTLSPQERKELIRRLLSMQDDTVLANRAHDILDFEGIAAHLADDEDPQAYVRRMRNEWNKRP